MKHKNLPRKARKLSSLDRYPSDAKTIFNKLCRTKPPQLGICTAPSHKKSKLKCETPCCKSTNFVPALRAQSTYQKPRNSTSTKTSVGATKQQSWRTIPTALISPRVNSPLTPGTKSFLPLMNKRLSKMKVKPVGNSPTEMYLQ